MANDYHIYRCDQASKGGGVLIAILKLLQSRHLPTHSSLEAVMIQIESRTVVLCVYIPPNCSDDYFSQLIECIQSLPEDKDLPLISIFLKLTGVLCPPYVPCAMTFCDCIFVKNFTQLICEPTHSLGNILDLVFSNSPDNVINL